MWSITAPAPRRATGSRRLPAAVGAAGAAWAWCAGTAAGATPPEPPTPVAGVTVVARRATAVGDVTVINSACPDPNPQRYEAAAAPQVIDSFPAQGAVVRPGVLVVRLTFDAPMTCDWAIRSVGDTDEPPCRPSASWDLPGRTTLWMQCQVKPGVRYNVLVGDMDGQDFLGMSGRKARPYRLRFSTSDAAPTASVQEALAADPRAPDPARVAAYVTCTDRPTGDTAAPCEREGAAQTGGGPPLR